MPPELILGDAESLAVAWARDKIDWLDQRVSTKLPAHEDLILPFLTVFRVGGRIEQKEYLNDRAFLQWECWAAKDDLREASRLARTLIAYAHEAQNVHYAPAGTDPGFIEGFEVTTGPRRVPTPDSRYGRFIVETFMYTRPG